MQGLIDRSRRPHHYAHKLPFQVENFILNVRRQQWSWGARKIRERLLRRFSAIAIPAKSTIHAVLDRHGLVERRGRVRRRAQHAMMFASWERALPVSQLTLVSCPLAVEGGTDKAEDA